MHCQINYKYINSLKIFDNSNHVFRPSFCEKKKKKTNYIIIGSKQENKEQKIKLLTGRNVNFTILFECVRKKNYFFQIR